jgi:multiple sugar transport system permease protein
MSPLRKQRTRRNSYLIAAICLALMAIMLFPLAMSLLTSIKPAGEAAMWPPNYLPSRLSFSNYVEMYTYQAGLPLYLFNSLSVAFMTIGGCLILAVLAGFGLARFSIPYKEIFFLLLICGMMIPYQTLLTPLYLMFSKLGMQNTRIGLAIVHTAIQLPFSVFLMRHSFEAVPRELEEAAIIDGCNSFQLLLRIFLPSVVPGIVTVALFAFLTSWNEFHRCPDFHEQGNNVHAPDHAGGITNWLLWFYRLGHSAGRGDDLDHPMRASLFAVTEILRVWSNDRGS